MKKYLVITNNEKYYLIEAISSMSAAKKLTSYLLKKNNVTLGANQKCRKYYRFN